MAWEVEVVVVTAFVQEERGQEESEMLPFPLLLLCSCRKNKKKTLIKLTCSNEGFEIKRSQDYRHE
jgi:hypothetical protein